MIYIFDMDGTLVDSNDIIHEGIGPYFEEHGIKYTVEVQQKTVACGYLGTAIFMANEFGVKKDPQIICNELKAITTKAYEERVPAKPYAVDLIKRLKKEGHRLFILSASPHTMIAPCLKRHGIFDCFEKIWSTEDFRLDKKDDELFISVANELKVIPSDCTIVEDSVVPVVTAKRVGMKVISVYDKHAEPFREKMKEISDRYLNDLSEF